MKTFSCSAALISALAILGLSAAAVSGAQDRGEFGPRGGFAAPFNRDGHGLVLDNRYNHGHYYPSRGVVVRGLPEGYRAFTWRDGSRFYFAGGVWYAPGPGGFIVTRPPFGLFVPILPAFYTTLWFGGVPYYYANDVYYGWDAAQNGYVVVAPPPGADNPEAGPPVGPAAGPAAAADDFFVYPKNGQSATQQAADRYECHTWSKSQTGYDPTQPNGGGAPGDNAPRRDQYRRAITACLEARGYSVK
jgi:uncharacterized protein DUF6515